MRLPSNTVVNFKSGSAFACDDKGVSGVDGVDDGDGDADCDRELPAGGVGGIHSRYCAADAGDVEDFGLGRMEDGRGDRLPLYLWYAPGRSTVDISSWACMRRMSATSDACCSISDTSSALIA